MSAIIWKRGDKTWLKHTGGYVIARVLRVKDDYAVLAIGSRSSRVPLRFLRPLATLPKDASTR